MRAPPSALQSTRWVRFPASRSETQQAGAGAQLSHRVTLDREIDFRMLRAGFPAGGPQRYEPQYEERARLDPIVFRIGIERAASL